MTLNPYFLHGSQSEQGLVQDLVNEHIRMFGLDVYYIPRKYIRTDNIIREVQSSAFDDTFTIEAYMNNYEGYAPGSDIMTKFGINLKNEVSLIISRERFEEFISPLLQTIIEGNETYSNGSGDLLFSTRPKEGDLIYFPLGQRLFEIKHVEFENPFYQLGKNYVYELKCELFEYEDEEINTPIDEIQERMSDVGYITTLTLVSMGSTAVAQSLVAETGVISKVFLNNDGFGYITAPTVSIEPPPAGGQRATAVAITTSTRGAVRAITDILLVNAGFGYTTPPRVTISGGGGTGAAATCDISNNAVYKINVVNGGQNYYTTPEVVVQGPTGVGITATAIANISVGGTISSIYISNAGFGYTFNPTVTIANPPLVGFGTFVRGEKVVGQKSGTVAVVKDWINTAENAEKTLSVQINDGQFLPGEVIVGTASSAQYSVKIYDTDDNNDKYRQNKDFETEADIIIDFSEKNPFGTY
jgi:hypothetical protein